MTKATWTEQVRRVEQHHEVTEETLSVRSGRLLFRSEDRYGRVAAANRARSPGA